MTGETVGEILSDYIVHAIIVHDVEDLIARNVLTRLLTPESKVHILQALIDLKGERLSASKICDKAGIDRTAWYRYSDDLLELEVVEEAGTARNAKMYRVDPDDPIIESLEKVYDYAAARAMEVDGVLESSDSQ